MPTTGSAPTTRFDFAYNRWAPFFAAIGLGPARTWVDVDEQSITVRLGWAFHSTFPRASVTAVEPDVARVGGWGAHGWHNVWLVNTSSRGMVSITLDPPARASTLAVPLHVKHLRLSLAQPAEFIATIAARRDDRGGRRHRCEVFLGGGQGAISRRWIRPSRSWNR